MDKDNEKGYKEVSLNIVMSTLIDFDCEFEDGRLPKMIKHKNILYSNSVIISNCK